MKKVCVFGGSGFLGSHVADQLTKAGYWVRVFDTHPSPWLKPGQEMVVGSIIDCDQVNDAVSDVDIVFNFAALADLNEALHKPIETISVNVLGNVNILEACRKHKAGRFVYASSVYVHSRDGGFYRCSKQASEAYVQEYKNIYDLDYTILRYGSLYGPRSNAANGLYRIVLRALETGVLEYVGSPETLREYIHVEDAAKASVAILESEFQNQSIVLTGQQPMRVFDLLEMLGEILGLNDAVHFVDGIQSGHYIKTPYAYKREVGRKYVPRTYCDLGEGLLELIELVSAEMSGKA